MHEIWLCRTHGLWSAQHLPITTPKLAQHTIGNRSNSVIGVVQGPPESLHQLRSHWLNMVIEEVWLKVVHTEFKSSETLADECLGAIEC